MKNIHEMDNLDLQDYINGLRTFSEARLQEELRLWKMVGQAITEEFNRRNKPSEEK